MKVPKIQEKGIKGVCISYGRSDNIYVKIVAVRPAQKGPLEKLIGLQMV
jgi:hypothetical protein